VRDGSGRLLLVVTIEERVGFEKPHSAILTALTWATSTKVARLSAFLANPSAFHRGNALAICNVPTGWLQARSNRYVPPPWPVSLDGFDRVSEVIAGPVECVLKHLEEQHMAIVFITGSTDGLGRAAAKSLLDQGHRVVLHARSAERAAALGELASRSEGVVDNAGPARANAAIAGAVWQRRTQQRQPPVQVRSPNH
jgi:short chain dehydrogenase